ncbi:hypothetical protein COMA1_11526 [Candidatus Nitrospira nitrosa]|uniref:Uncharacterized protein n=1 Tax=Candidatus Nitrospira nitrosa TaxID=1742972 RepID=A0A0S4LE03_9BACT|nr:hypothetical protein COMA1_11526 [Candidatus Nitrospira nitrosa]
MPSQSLWAALQRRSCTDRYLLWDTVQRRCLQDLLLCLVPNSYYNCTRLFAIQWIGRHQIVSQLDCGGTQSVDSVTQRGARKIVLSE